MTTNQVIYPNFPGTQTPGSPHSGDVPILHNITPDRVVFCYVDGDSDSYAIALYYANRRKVPAENLIALPCSTNHSITEAQFESTIEQPLLDAISGLEGGTGSQYEKQIWVIILGYKVPNIYVTDGEIIAVASRLNRLGMSYVAKEGNYLFDRQIFKYFDATDAEELYITAILDGPSTIAVQQLIDRSIDVDNQISIAGDFYLDPYGLQDLDAHLEYQTILTQFYDNNISDLSLTTHVTTTENAAASDPMFERLQNDSFYWGWFTTYYSANLFTSQNERRVFLYNADNLSASNIRDGLGEDSDKWCNLAINVEPGYACCAGAVDTPGTNAYLQPRSFFRALHKGASIGEAFMYSTPYVNWKLVFIGDPLMVVQFPTEAPEDNHIDPTQETPTYDSLQMIEYIKDKLETSITYSRRQSILLSDLTTAMFASTDITELHYMVNPLVTWRNLKSKTSREEMYKEIVRKWINYLYATHTLTVNEWLETYSKTLSPTLADIIEKISTQSIIDDNLLSAGAWDIIFTYNHSMLTYEFIHFKLQVSALEDFSVLTYNFDTLSSTDGWSYESTINSFTTMTTGFPSNFSGRRLKYSDSTNILTQGEIYYAQWIAQHDDGTPIGSWSIAIKFIVKM